MAKGKAISISLAAKCQLLFGLAVLVIIAGALAVPWQRMEQLAKQPNIKAARFAADLYFRQSHLNAQRAAATNPAARTTDPEPPVDPDHWDDAALIDGTYPAPHIFVAKTPADEFIKSADKVASDAMKLFHERSQEVEFGRVETLKEPASATATAASASPPATASASASTTAESSSSQTIPVGGLRVYRYAAAIRLDSSCLSCHSEYIPWTTGTSNPLSATRSTTTSLSPPPPGPAPPTGTTSASQPMGTGTITAEGPVIGVVRVDVPYQTDENQLLLNRIVIVVAGMLGGALAIVVFYLITSRLILQPVRVLKNTAEKVSAGDLNIRSAISTGDEFQHLSETFNTMLANLQASRDQLQATNSSLDTRVGELAQSNVDLYEANRVKSEFLTNVTHELRTPLNAIIGFADLMAETAARGNDPKQQRYSENIRTSAKQLLDLINDLLDLAKIEAGKLVIREEKVNVADVCEAMANFMRPLAQKKEITLEMSVDADMPLITTDPGRFQQILYNFLSNAIKFTPNEGRVRIAARCERESMKPDTIAAPPITGIRIAISDSGPGISPDDQKVIFEKFRQLDGSVTRHHSGSGLGLAISRELASMLGGKIELQSAAGKGATFSLIMPVERLTAEATVATPQVHEPGDEPAIRVT